MHYYLLIASSVHDPCDCDRQGPGHRVAKSCDLDASNDLHKGVKPPLQKPLTRADDGVVSGKKGCPAWPLLQASDHLSALAGACHHSRRGRRRESREPTVPHTHRVMPNVRIIGLFHGPKSCFHRLHPQQYRNVVCSRRRIHRPEKHDTIHNESV